MAYLLVFLGSGIGGLCRFFVSKLAFQFTPGFPTGTLVSNLIGMFFIGYLTIWMSSRALDSSPFRDMMIIGFLGGLTTFSSFGNESYELYKENRFIALSIYLSLNLFLGFLLLLLGKKLGTS